MLAAAQITSHAFDPWTYPSTGQTICIHVTDGRICDRSEHDHAPAPEEDAGA